MKEAFITKSFKPSSLATIGLANEIIGIYQAQGLRLTLRQLYYQFVTRNAIKNEERAYKALGSILSDARLAGLVDWDAIEDRVRIPRMPSEWSGLKSLVNAALYGYRLPRWRGQEKYIELWVEKDALSGVLLPLAQEYHVTLMVNRGYSSQSAMHDAFERFQGHQHQECHLLYLGDHSGEDMVRDVQDRLTTFGVDVSVRKIALTMSQVRQYDPPPNPAKMSDSRAAKYVDRHGDESWEVDALPPDVLNDLVREAIEEHLDEEMMNDVKAQEELDKAKLRRAVEVL